MQTGGYIQYDTQEERDMLCPTCVGRKYAPYRVYDDRGKVLQGCVDVFHTDHLVTPSESSRWHNRPAAKAIRARSKAFMLGKGSQVGALVLA